MRKSSSWIRTIPVLLGFMGLSGALILGAVKGDFNTFHGLVGVISLISIAGGLLWLRDLRWKDSLTSICYSVFVIICLSLIYLISANRYMRYDLTRDKIHTLSESTQELLTALDPTDRYEISLFAPIGEHQSLQAFLNNYRELAPQINYSIYDPVIDLKAAMEYGGEVDEGTMIITRFNAQGEEMAREVGSLDVGDLDKESRLTNTFARMLYTDQRVIYYTSGHGEKPLDGSEESLTKVAEFIVQTSLPIKELRMTQGPIPDNAAAIIIAGPLRDLFDPEREMLEKYLQQGGKLLVLLDPLPQLRQAESLENFERLLNQYGIDPQKSLVVDPDVYSITQNSYTPQVLFTNNEIGQKMGRNPFLLDRARDFLPTEDVASGISLEVFLVSSEKAWTESYQNLSDLRSTRSPVPPDDSEEIGTKYLAMAAEKQNQGGRFGDVTRVVAIGDSEAFADYNAATNGSSIKFMLEVLAWMREERGLIYVPQKILSSTPVRMTGSTFWTLSGILFLLGIAITFGGTFFALARRRS